MPLPIHSAVLAFTAAALLALSGCGGGSSQSNANPEPTATPVAALAAPASVIATTDAGQVTLQWNPVKGAASYAIYMDAPATRAALVSKVKYADTVTSPHTVNGLTRGQTYSFTIVAITADGSEGEESAVIPVRLSMTATALVTGAEHSCALLSDGAVKCWGRNDASQLGSAVVDYSASPVAVPGVANAKSISAAGQHSCAVLNDGSLQCWGTYGEGDAAVKFTSPIVISGVASAVSVTSSRDTDCALLSDATVACFSPIPAPVQVPIGTSLTVTIPSDTTPVEWDSSGIFDSVPAFAPSLSKAPTVVPIGVIASGVANVKQIVAGTDFTCALLNDGTVTCWSGVMGRWGSIAPQLLPNIAEATAITARGSQACVLMPAGVQCWHMSRHGCMYPPDGGVQCWMRGDYRAPLIFAFLQIQGALSEIKAIAVGADASLTDASPSAYFAIVNGGAVYKWNVLPLCPPGFICQISPAALTPVSLPVLVTDLVNVAAIANGNAHGCALLLSGDVMCWDDNQYGQVGNGEISATFTAPVAIKDL